MIFHPILYNPTYLERYSSTFSRREVQHGDLNFRFQVELWKMRSTIKIEESKPKNGEIIREIHRVAKANSLKLQHLELAVANLTSIFNELKNDGSSIGIVVQGGSVRKVKAEVDSSRSSSAGGSVGKVKAEVDYSRSSSAGGSVGKVKAEVNEVKLHSSPSRSTSPGLDLKDQKLGLQMQQLVDQAAALGIFKDNKTTATKVSGQVKILRAPTTSVSKNMQATTTQKSSTKQLIQTKEPATQKKLYVKIGATQSKGKTSPRSAMKNKNPMTAGKVSLKSTVKKTETTISEVLLTNKKKETSGSNISVKSSIKNVKTMERKGSLKLRIAGKSLNATKSRDLVTKSASPRAATVGETDLKPRRRWSTTRDINLK